MLDGDFRQTLPAISRSTPADESNVCLKYSTLWRHVRTLQLTTNMRVQLQNDPSAEVFSWQLLQIGNGLLPVYEMSRRIYFLDHVCSLVASKAELIKKVFLDIQVNYKNHHWLSESLARSARDANTRIKIKNTCANYPFTKYQSAEIMQRHAICSYEINEKHIGNKDFNGSVKGVYVLIPRIPIIPIDTQFQLKRLQCPVRIAFAITINKDQSFEMRGLDLDQDCFLHGQLYVL